jgi:tetratricopeptide (TPR) repeat protein
LTILQEISGMRLFISYLIFQYLIFNSILSVNAQDLFNLQNSRKFAYYLYLSGDFDLAIKEYERVIFFDSTDFESKLNLVKSYRHNGDYQKAIMRNRQFFNSYEDITYGFSNEYCKSLILNNSLDETRKFLSWNSNITEEDKIFFLVTTELFDENYDKAREIINMNQNQVNPYIDNYSRLLNNEMYFKYKSPALSVGLSSIIPGSGKIYSGAWKDGLVSLFFVATSAFQSYRGFEKKGIESAYGWVFGGLAAGFYVGNLFGSGKAAHKYNYNLKHNLRHKIEEIFYSYD